MSASCYRYAHFARPAVERHREMIRPRMRSLLDGRNAVSDLHAHLGRLADEDVDGDLIQGNIFDGVRCVARLVSNGPSVRARSGWVRLVIVYHFLLRHRGCHAVFIRRDIVREEIAPRLVRIGEDVALGVCRETRRLDRANIVAFTIVVPRDYLVICQYKPVRGRENEKPEQMPVEVPWLAATGSTTDHLPSVPNFCHIAGGWCRTRARFPSCMVFRSELLAKPRQMLCLSPPGHQAMHPS